MTTASTSLALGDLLAEETLALRLLVGGDDAHGRPVAGVHPIEIDSPSGWMAPNWVMLTTGVRLLRRPAAQRTLIRELHEARISALGFGVGVGAGAGAAGGDVVPPALLDEARRCGYPVFEVPLGTPFREIVRHVDRLLLVPEARHYERLPAIHRYMFDALAQEDPDTTLLTRLAALVDVDVLLFDEDGQVEFASSALPTQAVWERIARRPDSHLVEFELDGRHVVAVPTSVAMSGPTWWIVACPRRATTLNPLIKPSVQAAAPLIAAIKRIDAVGHEREQRQRAALLDAALEAEGEQRFQELASQLLVLGFDLADTTHLVRLEHVADLPQSATEALGRGLHRKLARASAPCLLSVHRGSVVALVCLPAEALREILQETLAEQSSARAGVSSPLTEIAQVPFADRDACTALSLTRNDAEGRPGFFVECDIGALLVSRARDETLRRTITRRLDPLLEHPPLYETLRCYFDNALDIGASSKALFVHPNTMRNRIARIEELLGSSLRQPAVIAEVHLALTAMPAAARG